MVVSSSICDVTHAECMALYKYADVGCSAAGSLCMPLGQLGAVRSETGVTGFSAESRSREWYQLLCLKASAKLKHTSTSRKLEATGRWISLVFGMQMHKSRVRGWHI